jgi:type VI secretion system protein ImpL
MIYRLFRLLFSRGMLVFLGLLALAAIIWFGGPLLAIADYRPLESEWARWICITVIFGLWALRLLFRWWRAKNINDKLLSRLAKARETEAETAEKILPGEEEVAVLQARFNEALAVLKKRRIKSSSKGSGWRWFSRQYLYELPWYIFIGAPGSGKTTALINSGLSFPLAERFGKAAVRGVGGTRNCDWWFTDEAVLLDTAGRYTTHESNEAIDKAEWGGFLDLLKQFRPQQPINGVILTISVADLLSMDAQARMQHALQLKKRLNELREGLCVQFPVYVMVAKTDLLAGFSEYFDGLGKDERAQVWGFTFPHTEVALTQMMIRETFLQEFQLLDERINTGLAEVLLKEPDLSRRAKVYAFPQQFAGLQDLLLEILEIIFTDSKFTTPPLLRGVYFTSGTQEGTPFDRILNSMQEKFGVTAGTSSGTFSGESGKSFFLQHLLTQLIFPESYLAGRNVRWERRHRWLRLAGYAGVCALLGFSIAAWWVSYEKNRRYIAEVGVNASKLAKIVQAAPREIQSDVIDLVPVMTYAHELPYSKYFSFPDAPLSYYWGLYQGRKLGAASNITYQRVLDDSLLLLVAQRVERALREISPDDPLANYETLKTYLMLYSPEHYDGRVLRDWVMADWDASLPLEIPKEERDELDLHLSNLLLSRVVSSPFPQDERLVMETQARLAYFTLPQRIYSRLKRQLMREYKDLLPFTVAGAGGVQAPLVFARSSGAALTEGVPGLFSYYGYYEVFSKEVSSAALRMIEEEDWVLGGHQKKLSDKIADWDKNKLILEVRRLYLLDYVKYWESFLDDVRLIRPASLQQSIQLTKILSSLDSPMEQFVRAASDETTLIRAPRNTGDRSLFDRAKTRLNATKADVEKVIGPISVGGRVPQRLESIVDNRFETLRRLAETGTGAGVGGIDAVKQSINELYTYLLATEAALQGGSPPPPNIMASKLRAEAARLPEPLRGMMLELAATGSAHIAGVARVNLSTSLSSTVSDFCRKAIAGRYPFNPNAAQEVTADDFARMFAPNGLMDDFFQKNLASIVDMSSNPWRFKQGVDNVPRGGAASLAAFQRAATIKDVFFYQSGNRPSFQVELKPVEMDASITDFTLDVDGQILKYSHGPQVPTLVTWPGQRNSRQVRTQLLPNISGSSGLLVEGPWALHRLFDKAQIVPGNSPERLMMILNLDGRRIVLEVTSSSVQNPFRLRQIQEFSCPSGF